MIDELFKDYYKYSDFYDIFNKYRNYEREMRFLFRMIKDKKRVLDLGCGTGTHLNILDNRRSNDDVYDVVDGNKRYMECFYSPKYSMQIRTINFTIGLKTFTFEHEFFIYKKKKLEEILDKYDVSYALLTNFFRQRANDESKRIHVVIRKNG